MEKPKTHILIFLITISFLFSFQQVNAQQPHFVGKNIQYTSADSTIARALKDTVHFLIQFQRWEYAIPYILECKKAYAGTFGEKYWRVGYMWGKLGFVHFHRSEYQKSMKAYEKALQIVEPARPESISIPDYYNNLSIIYSIYHNYPKALDLMEKSIQPTIEKFGEYSEENRISYLNLGTLNLNIRNLEMALKHNLRSLKIGKKIYKKDAKELISNYINTGAVLVEMRSYERANFYLLKALNLSKKYSNKNIKEEMALLYNKFAQLEFYSGDYKEALRYIQIMENYCKENLPPNHYYVSNGYGLKASIYLGVKDFDQSANYIKLKHKDLSNPHMKAEFHNFLGEIYTYRKEYQNAIKEYQIALEVMDDKAMISDFNKSRTNTELAKAYFKNNQLKLAEEKLKLALRYLGIEKDIYEDVLTDYALALYEFDFAIELYNHYFSQTKDEKYLTLAEDYAQKAMQLVEIRNQNPSEIYQYMLAEQVHSILSKAIQTQYLYYEKTKDKATFLKALNAAERSKSYLLKQALQQRKALNEADDASFLFEKEKDLRYKIAYLEKEFFQKNSSNPWFNDSVMVDIKLQISQLKEEHRAIKNQLKKDYKEFFDSKNNSNPNIILEDIQQNLLDGKSSLLEYVLGEEDVYVFLIQKNNYDFIQLKKDFPLEDWIRKLNQEGIYGYYEKPVDKRDDNLKYTSVQNYTEYGHLIYQKLIAPFQKQLANTERVIIIPDGDLGVIPFEALLTDKVSKKRLGKYRKYPFFIFKNTISYAHSISLLGEMSKKEKSGLATKSVLAIAPFYQKNKNQASLENSNTDYFALRQDWNLLKSSGEEAVSIAKLWKGDCWLGKEATLKKFIESSSFYQIIHFATHSKMDNLTGNFAYLAVTDSIPLMTKDLYNYNFNADAVILSACETGRGKIRNGEGMIGLTRAFSYAGAKSVFATLWKVNDSHTKDLMILFHENLKKEMLKDEALAFAKKTYLENSSKKTENLHPFFWAGMIGIGDMSSIEN